MWIYEVALYWDNNPEEVRASEDARREAVAELHEALFPYVPEPEDYERLPELVDAWEFDVDSVQAFTERGAVRKARRVSEADRAEPLGRVRSAFQWRRARRARQALDAWRCTF